MTLKPPFLDLPAPAPRPPHVRTPLEGIRVIDFTRYLAGPYCTQALADLGAEVIKVESPQGDETRSYKPPEVEGMSPYFLGFNRGKQSIVIDLSRDSGRALAGELVAAADIVVENFSPGVMAKFGLGAPALCAAHPRLIYCSITGYGSQGSHAQQPGFDSVFQAESGFASLTGDPDRLPMRTGTPIIDIAASMNGVSAILAALYARERTGEGQFVEVALYDTAIALLGYFSMNFLASGKDPVRTGNTAPVATPIGMFETASGGAIYVSCGTQRSWENLAAEVIGRPDLLVDPRFADNRQRNLHKGELMALLADIFASRPRDHWMALARRQRAPIGAVRSVGEALMSDLARERGMVARIADALGREFPNISSPLRLQGTPVAEPRPAPRLGEHSLRVLREVAGYGQAGIDELIASGAVAAEKTA